MSDEATTTTAAAAPAAPAKIPDEVIAQIAEQATKQLSAQMNSLADKSSSKAVEDVISRLSGKQNHENLETQVLQMFIDRPTEVLAKTAEQARSLALEEFRAERQREKEEQEKVTEKNREFRSAVNELYEKRPDIKSNEAISELVTQHYVNTDPTLSEAERLEIAVKKADKQLEKIDGKKAEERIQAVMSVSSSGAAPAAPAADPEVVLQDYGKNYCSSREEDYRKKFGSLPPRG